MTFQFDGMKRTVAALLALLLLATVQPAAEALQTREVWDGDRTLRANWTVPAAVDLVIGPGVNTTLEPDENAYYPSPVFLNIAGGLEVCGTADRPARMHASRDFFHSYGMPGGYLNLTGNGMSGQLSVRNCSFENLLVFIESAAGQFTDCVFNGSFVYVADSPASFVNCTFVGAAVSIYSPASINETVLSGCVFDARGVEGWDPFWGYFSTVPAIKLSGYALIERCDIRGFGYGIQSLSGVPVVADCTVRDCGTGIELQTTDPTDTPVVERCVVQDCSQKAIRAYGNLLLRDCVLSNSTHGLELYDNNMGAALNRTLSGNRIFGNGMYGITLAGADVDLGDTLFDDGAGGTNGLGRVEKRGELQVFLPLAGTGWLPDLVINVTDAFGDPTPVLRYINSSYHTPLLIEYIIDNSGNRLDYYPYTVSARWKDVFCETVVWAGTANVTLRLEVLPDLLPLEITLDPLLPRGGDWVAISCTVNNTGPTASVRVPVLFMLDGERLDRGELFPVGARASSFVRAQDWRARPGTHTVTVWIDPDNELSENDESNNNLTFNFTVRAAPPQPQAGPSAPVLAGAVLAVLIACGAAVIGARRWKRKGGS